MTTSKDEKKNDITQLKKGEDKEALQKRKERMQSFRQ